MRDVANSKARTPRRVASARLAAAEILRRVEEEGAYASVLLAASAQSLRPDDRSLTYELVLGTLRWQLWLDRCIEHFAGGRKVETLDAPVRLALRLGLYQLRFLTRIPPSAAVNDSVNLAYEFRLRSAASFINAVLRRALREPNYDPALEAANKLEHAAISTSHPAWLIEKWARNFGWEEALAFARANNEIPRNTFRINTQLISKEAAVRRISEGGATPIRSELASGAWRIEKGHSSLLQQMASEGLIYFQDEASQLVPAVLDSQPGERILDVCAAPGSKATQIAINMRDTGWIIGGDLYLHRLRGLRESAARQGLKTLSLLAFDASAAIPFADSSFDRVLIDAPCSGTGTLRHNPEIRWRISSADILELSDKQKKILRLASRLVKKGGRLIYSTCSVEPEENEEVAATILSEQGGVLRLAPEHLPKRLIMSSGMARTWPQRQESDGFFVAVFERQ